MFTFVGLAYGGERLTDTQYVKGPTLCKGMQGDSSWGRGAVLHRMVREGISDRLTFESESE